MSSAPLRVFLTIAEEKTLFELSKAKGVPQRTRDRASAIRLSSMGWKIEKIAVYLKWSGINSKRCNTSMVKTRACRIMG